MEKYRLHVYFRHYVHDEDTLERYKNIVNRVNRATKLANFSFSVLAQFDPGMSQTLKDELNGISKKLIENDVEFSVRVGHGSGFAIFKTMEEVLSSLSVDREDVLICVIDGDAYAIDDARFLRQIRKLADSVHRKKALMGLAQRSKIVLGEGEMETYREIGELYIALAMRGKLPVKKSVELKVPGGYAELGDPVPGVYCFNVTHPKFIELFRMLEEDMKKADITKFTGDLYLVLASAQLGGIETEIVPLEDNPPGSFRLDSIKTMSYEIGKTSMRKVYLHAVQSEENAELLKRYYPPQDVEKVRGMILESMLKR